MTNFLVVVVRPLSPLHSVALLYNDSFSFTFTLRYVADADARHKDIPACLHMNAYFTHTREGNFVLPATFEVNSQISFLTKTQSLMAVTRLILSCSSPVIDVGIYFSSESASRSHNKRTC